MSHQLQIKKNFQASLEQVYDAWIKPEIMQHWFAPSDEMECAILELTPEVGGKYRIQMKGPEGIFTVGGEYIEMDRPNKLAFTWQWEGEAMGAGPENTLVTVQLEAKGGETELFLTHERLSTEESAQKHTQGWNGCLSRLVPALQK